MPYVVSLFSLAMSISSMSHVNFKKRPRRCVEFRGQGPFPTTKHLVSALIQKRDVSPGACKDLPSAAGEMEVG